MQSIAISLYYLIQRKYILKKKQEQSVFRKQIDFDKGETVNLKGFSNKEISNKINTRYSIRQRVQQFIVRPGNLILIIINILCLSLVDDAQLYLFQFITPLICNIFAFSALVTYYENIKRNEDNKVNSREVIVFRKLKKFIQNKKIIAEDPETKRLINTDNQNHDGLIRDRVITSYRQEQRIIMFETVKWEAIEVGDIVLLQRNEISPADLLILESSDEKILAETSALTGNSSKIFKQANLLTQTSKSNQFKGNIYEYRSTLSGTIVYDIDDDEYYQGYMRLKNDPQAVDVKKENFLFREQLLFSCDYIYGIVLYAGKQCRYYRETDLVRSNQSFFTKKANRFYSISFVMILVMSLISWLVESLIYSKYGRTTNQDQIAIYLLYYLNFIPFYLYFFIDIFLLLNSIYKSRLFYQKQKVEKTNIEALASQIELQCGYQQVNETPLADLALIDCAIFDKTGTLTIPKFKIRMVFLVDTLFKINYKTFKNAEEWKKFKEDVAKNQTSNGMIREERDTTKKLTILAPMRMTSIKVSPRHTSISPMGANKRLSLIPTWKLNEENLLQVEQIEPDIVQDTSQHEEANFNPQDIDDENPRLKEIHKTRAPVLFKAESSWGSQLEFGTSPQAQTLVQGDQPRQSSSKRKVSDRASEMFDSRKKMSDNSNRNFPKFSKLDDEKEYKNLDEMILDEKQIFKRQVAFDYRQSMIESMLALCLCHNTTTKYSKYDDQFSQEFTCTIDQIQQNLVEQYDFKFICSTNGKTVFVIQYEDKFIDIAVNITYLTSKRLSVIAKVQDFKSHLKLDYEDDIDYIQFIRDDSLELESLIFLEKDEKEGWDCVINKMHISGCRPVVFYKSYLNRYQYEHFLRRLPTDDLNGKDRNYELCMILGIAEKVKKQARDVIKLMNKYQITTWMASGDSLDKVLPIAYSTKLLDENMTVVHFFQDPQSLIKQQIQNIYNQVKNQKTNKLNRQGLTGNLISPNNINRRQSMKKRQSVNLSRRISTRGLPFITQQEELKIKSFAILISGSILEKISLDQNLFEHFSFLVFFSNQLIGYRMTAYQKYILLDLIQNQQGSKKRVLAIGDQINDSIMFKYADYSLQIRHDRVFQDTKFDKVEQLVRAKSGGPRNSKSKSFLRAIRFLYQLNKSLYEYIQIVSNTDIVIKNIKEIPKLLFYESKLHAELFENLINHSFYRQYLIGFVVFFLFCFQKQPNYLPIGFFQGVYFILGGFVIIRNSLFRPIQKIFSYDSISKYYQQNQINFRKKRFKKFLYKVIFFSFIEALLISIIHVNIQFIDENGFMLDDKLNQYQLVIILLIMELTKLLQIKFWILTFVILISYFSLLNISFLTNYYEEYNFYSILTAAPSVLFILLMSLIFYVFQLLFNSIEGLQVQTEISGDLDDDEIKQMTHVISIMYKQAQRDKDYELNLISSLVNKIFKNEDSIDINIKQMLSGITFAEKSANISIFNQQFINKQLEFKYQQFQRPNSILFNTYYIPLSWIMLEGVIFIQLLTLDDFGWFFYLSISYNCLAILYVLGIPFGLLRKYVWQYSKILIISRAIYKIIYDINFFQNNNNGLNDMVIMQFFMIQPVFDNDPMIFVFYQLAIVISFYVRYSSINSSQDVFIDYYIMISYYIISLIQMVLMIWIFYKLHRQYREQYILKFKKLQKISQMTDTLAILMPKFIRNKINESNTLDYNIEIQQGQVAILFCDICGFDQIISDLKENVVVLLDQLFRQFDSLCPQYKLQKIETVGKTYMAAAGINEMNQNLTNPVFRAVQMAMEMINQAQSCKYQNIDNVVVKIGIHYGYVIAGVIGDHKPQFSLIGDTVNTTSRLCSTGQDGQIIISEQAYYQIQQVTIWKYNSNIVEAKGKGKLCTFIVEKEKIEGKKKLKQLKKYKSEQSNKIQFPITRSPNNISDDTQTRKISSIDRPKKPSFVAPSLKLMVPLPHKSSLNLEQHSSGYNKSSHQGEEVQAQPQQKTYEGKDLIESLELKLQKDNIIVESGIQFPSYEADREKLRKLYQNEDEDQQQQDVLILDKRKLYLDFSDDTEDIDLQIFKDQTINQGYNQTLLLSFLSSFLIIIQTSLMIMVQEVYYNKNLWIIILILGYTLPVGQIIFLIYSITNRSNGFIITEQYFGIISILQYLWWLFSTLSVLEFDIGEIYISFGVILQLFHQFTPMFQIKFKLLYGLILGLSIIFVVLIKQWNLILIFYGLMEILLTSAVQYYTFYMSVKEYNQIQEIERKYLKQDELIKHQLPKHILDKFLLQSQERQILTEIFDDVTLLFADIAGFTEYSSSVQPEQVVQMLRKLFMEFDQICQTNNCYKLYTIGDCYVVMGMVDALDRNQAQEAKNIIEMGFEMINKIKEVRNNINFTELDMRIGVHTGSIIGGVLGTDIVRYDIYGPDVLIANKMESKGQKGKVHISGRTKEIIETCFADEYTISYSTTINLDSIDRKVVGFFIDRRSECDVSLEEQKQYSQC